MIQFNNVGKTYVSKKKNRVDALKNVSFELGNTGMVFILGKSGSGKSTLLNLLGGLDAPTSGEIVVDGVSMSSFKQTDYDGYRNGYVGFIFQEFNLLDDFNVKENISLALQLSRGENIDGKVADALRQVELSDEYLTRRVGEMSGGERQRVAIARCIVKESRMILADEPTGNLDSATGESIWNILKDLSKSKLVVVVSHDRESAEKYADRIIEIADGNILSDSGAQPIETEKSALLTLTKKRLPFFACLKMGVNNILQRKVKNIFIVLLSILTIAVLLISEMALNMSPERSLARFVKQNDIPYIVVTNGVIGDNYKKITSTNLKQSTRNHIQQYSQCLLDGIVEGKQDILDFGLTFVGDALELDSNSFYVSKYYVDYMTAIRRVEIGGEMIPTYLFEEMPPYEYFVGKKVDCTWTTAYDGNYPTLAGIVDTDALGIYAFNIPAIFARSDFESRLFTLCSSYNLNALNVGITRLEYGEKSSSKNIKIGQLSQFGDVLITADSNVGEGLKQPDDVTLADDEIVLSYDLYAVLFNNVGAEHKYVGPYKGSVWSVPEHLGQTFSLKLYDNESGELLFDVGEFKLVGISFEDNSSKSLYVGLSEQTLKDLWTVLGANTLYVRTDSVKHLESFLTKMRSSYGGYIVAAGRVYTVGGENTDAARMAYDFVDDLTEFTIVFGAIGAILLLVLLLMVVNLITFSITARKREIGILMGLGASNRDVRKIFILEALIISVLSFIFALCATLGIAAIFNAEFSKGLMTVIPMFCVEYVTVAVLFVISFGFILFAAWLPLLKIVKLKPIDAIRSI
ncbi:MAG: ABC transporter ATP-binding protein/permease [Clostridiales bacterium]|nr:ABC transporter ATP-binding protein/permease [Clostridiales bacterium]